MQCVAVCCSVLQCVAVLQCLAGCCSVRRLSETCHVTNIPIRRTLSIWLTPSINASSCATCMRAFVREYSAASGVLQCVAVCCSVLQHVGVLQCVAVCCSVLLPACGRLSEKIALFLVCCSVLQRVAACCSMLLPACRPLSENTGLM